jgi:hypothetical protein
MIRDALAEAWLGALGFDAVVERDGIEPWWADFAETLTQARPSGTGALADRPVVYATLQIAVDERPMTVDAPALYEQLELSGFVVEEDDHGRLKNIHAEQDIATVVGSASASGQRDRLADWFADRFNALADLAPAEPSSD